VTAAAAVVAARAVVGKVVVAAQAATADWEREAVAASREAGEHASAKRTLKRSRLHNAPTAATATAAAAAAQ
jgi:hypothetical protein